MVFIDAAPSPRFAVHERSGVAGGGIPAVVDPAVLRRALRALRQEGAPLGAGTPSGAPSWRKGGGLQPETE